MNLSDSPMAANLLPFQFGLEHFGMFFGVFGRYKTAVDNYRQNHGQRSHRKSRLVHNTASDMASDNFRYRRPSETVAAVLP